MCFRNNDINRFYGDEYSFIYHEYIQTRSNTNHTRTRSTRGPYSTTAVFIIRKHSDDADFDSQSKLVMFRSFSFLCTM